MFPSLNKELFVLDISLFPRLGKGFELIAFYKPNNAISTDGQFDLSTQILWKVKGW